MTNPVVMLRDSPWGWTMSQQTPGVSDKSPEASCRTGCWSDGPSSSPNHPYPFPPICRDWRAGDPFPEHNPLPPRPCEYDMYRTQIPVHWSLGGGVVGISTYIRRF